MITKQDVDTIVHAIQKASIRDGLTMCFIVVDTQDGSMATFAPADVNKIKLIEMAADLYGLRKPEVNFTTAPKNGAEEKKPESEAKPEAPAKAKRRRRA
jgi:hypothetical protein